MHTRKSDDSPLPVGGHPVYFAQGPTISKASLVYYIKLISVAISVAMSVFVLFCTDTNMSKNNAHIRG